MSLGYRGERPEGASVFEAQLGLAPLGEDLAARVERAEHLIGLMAAALVDSTADRARIWTGSFAPQQVEVPVPAAAAVETALNAYRSPDELAARRGLDEYMHSYDTD